MVTSLELVTAALSDFFGWSCRWSFDPTGFPWAAISFAWLLCLEKLYDKQKYPQCSLLYSFKRHTSNLENKSGNRSIVTCWLLVHQTIMACTFFLRGQFCILSLLLILWSLTTMNSRCCLKMVSILNAKNRAKISKERVVSVEQEAAVEGLTEYSHCVQLNCIL